MLQAKRNLKSHRPRGYRDDQGNIEVDNRSPWRRGAHCEDE
jgi:hypothetical protein